MLVPSRYCLFLLLAPLSSEFCHNRRRSRTKEHVVVKNNIAQDDDLLVLPEQLIQLIEQAGYDKEDVLIEQISSEAAFCNRVFRIHHHKNSGDTDTVIAKLFSQLALKRMDPTRKVGELDSLAAKHGLAPSILAANDAGILMQDCHGRILTEKDIHQQQSVTECARVAEALARLHSIDEPKDDSSRNRPNMLWRACDVMLKMSNPYYQHNGWTLKRLRQAVERHKERIEALHIPVVSIGHGDFKPSNVILSEKDHKDVVRFIDLELAGKHYRSFDLAKLFRTDQHVSELSTLRNQQSFYEAYAGYCNRDKPSVQALELEAALLLPMTWLEAAIFFVCMASQDAGQAIRWKQLASNRLESYEQSIEL